MICVMDANALIAYLADEPGAEVVDSILADEGNTCYVHAINMCEIYYDVARKADRPMAQQSIARLVDAGVAIRDDMDSALWRQAGDYKAELRRISLADCFCLALADRLAAQVVTSDHHEFDPVAERAPGRVKFIR